MKENIQSKLSALGWHLNRSQRKTLRSSQADLKALRHLPSLDLHYVPWTGPALQPAAVATLLNEVIIHERRRVLEFGAGISTLYLANYFSKTEVEGHVVSVEEDGEWCEVVREYMRKLGISSKHFQIVGAPLRPYGKAGECEKWYDTDILSSELRDQSFDLVLVDGPAAYEKGREPRRMARLPALPFAREYLADDFTVFLDDARRDGEEEIKQRWQERFDVGCSMVSEMWCFRPRSDRRYYNISV